MTGFPPYEYEPPKQRRRATSFLVMIVAVLIVIAAGIGAFVLAGGGHDGIQRITIDGRSFSCQET